MNRVIIKECPGDDSPDSLVGRLRGEPGVVLLRTSLFDSPHARYSFVTARPFLTFRSFGSRCELHSSSGATERFGNPWRVLDELISRYELLDETDLPFPLGGCFGYWGYDLKNFVEPKLRPAALNDLELPDCHVGFYDSLVVFDHGLGKTWIVATGLCEDGSRSEIRTRQAVEFWREQLGARSVELHPELSPACRRQEEQKDHPLLRVANSESVIPPVDNLRDRLASTFSRAGFLAAVERALRYIHAGDIYQVNLSQRLSAKPLRPGWEMFQRLNAVSPAPFAAFLDCGEFQLASSSPELFMRLSGRQIVTRPIKGTRPRSPDPTRDAQLNYELQTSAKEMAELVMITDLLRNDLGRVCEYGSVQVPELVRLERFAQVQHLVSTVEGRLRGDVTHFGAFAACFPGGSVTGAPKFRALEIIDELEPVTRGPYTGALGYLGFNRESQVGITIRTALCLPDRTYFHAGAGIVADSNPEAEYEETLAKAGGFFSALNLTGPAEVPVISGG